MLEQKILEKSKEAFILAIEIYNKPSIKYRVEGFSFFICNAWELMLKAYMIKKLGTDSIYYKDNPARTITLEGNKKGNADLGVRRIYQIPICRRRRYVASVLLMSVLLGLSRRRASRAFRQRRHTQYRYIQP